MDTGAGNLIWVGLVMLIVLIPLIGSRLLREQGQGQSMDADLRPEIDANLAALKDYWARVRPRESREDEVHSMQKRLYAREFAGTPLPSFSRQAYQRQLPQIRQSKNGKKAIAVTNFYADLERLEEIQQELQAALAAGERAGDDKYEEFLHIAGVEWGDAWHRIERLLAQGNPLS